MIEMQHCSNYSELSQRAADIVQSVIAQNAHTNLGLPTGDTPLGMYSELRGRDIDWSTVSSYNLDEYEGIDSDHELSYRRYMHSVLHGVVSLHSAHFPCEHYDATIERVGGLHLTVLGLGLNGHIAFNEPGSTIDSSTRIVELDATTVSANSARYTGAQPFPRRAYTMGVATILRSQRILLLVRGTAKHSILQRALHGSVSCSVPASYLQSHSNTTVLYCD